MKYILYRVIDKGLLQEVYTSNDLNFLREMKQILIKKEGIYFVICEVII